jgi:hypothetical protein
VIQEIQQIRESRESVNRVMIAFNARKTGHWFGMRPNGWSSNGCKVLDDGREVSEAPPLQPGVDGCSVATGLVVLLIIPLTTKALRPSWSVRRGAAMNDV